MGEGRGGLRGCRGLAYYLNGIGLVIFIISLNFYDEFVRLALFFSREWSIQSFPSFIIPESFGCVASLASQR